jgi:hypothetical protein
MLIFPVRKEGKEKKHKQKVELLERVMLYM